MGSEGRPLVLGGLVSGIPLGLDSSSGACVPAQAHIISIITLLIARHLNTSVAIACLWLLLDSQAICKQETATANSINASLSQTCAQGKPLPQLMSVCVSVCHLGHC